ncbi:T9SS type A sorting domain-containing protein [Reichenbachiella versicolor]|uniref:T9SS type A sorting domain-containing protein n=1 Tax=Reichenbachiella versicolor TaxID=1821036 RepID=UPI000D6E2D35|nr:T9SS type A sorting domain-containing protein [Reichenbachiella versicolor]
MKRCLTILLLSISLAGSAEAQIGINKQDSSLEVYPNPTSHFIFVQLPDYIDNPSLQIKSMIGNDQEAYIIKLTETKYKIDVSKFSDGYYYLIATASGYKETFRFLKK